MIANKELKRIQIWQVERYYTRKFQLSNYSYSTIALKEI
jgi:hypothetical protein